ncbi:hypothetical protein GDO81_007812 [Engystomops pustulosus]|uniref:Uncharacterized protein n=1 Tax=Engystomops pustulosus TaxID=76066 RepID=A0AAV7CBX9_ENGPU|nr:hypothetical protein GDO81_007812 [Engystomops pustulosus]
MSDCTCFNEEVSDRILLCLLLLHGDITQESQCTLCGEPEAQHRDQMGGRQWTLSGLPKGNCHCTIQEF